MDEIKEFVKDQLLIKILKNREEMGKKAAQNVAKKILEIIDQKGKVNMAFAAAPSQNEFLNELTKFKNIEWSKITAFQLDEYIGLEDESPQKFSSYLKDHLFDKTNFYKVYYIDQKEKTIDEKIGRFSDILLKHPLDIACIGIGENGHIAFNDPYVADFADPQNVKKVCLDLQCRMQQVNDGCFQKIPDVPTHALTMTIPAIMQANYIYCVVPGKNKAKAVSRCIKGEIGSNFPASILRNQKNAILYLDSDAASLL